MDHPHDRHLKLCDECEQLAAWVRRTQVAGNHYFCEAPAQAEEAFGQEDPSYFYWEQLPSHDSEGGDLERDATAT